MTERVYRVVLVALVMLASTCFSQGLYPIKVEAPSGMISNMRPDLVNKLAEQNPLTVGVSLSRSWSPYLLNVDITRPGEIRPRMEMAEVSTSDTFTLYGAIGYENLYYGQKLIFGVHESTFVWFDRDTVPHTSIVGHFFCSDSFGVNMDNPVSGMNFPYRATHHDFFSWRDLIFHCDGKSTPTILTTSQTFVFQDSTDSAGNVYGSFDTTGYEPRTVSMGLEAPGQLRVGLTDMQGPLKGAYRYAYAFFDSLADTTDGLPASRLSLWSAIVSPEKELPYLAQFEKFDDDADTGMWKIVVRERQDGAHTRYVIDTIKLIGIDTIVTTADIEIHHRKHNPLYAHRDYTYQIIVSGDGAADTVEFTTAGLPFMDSTISDIVDSLNNMTTMSDSVQATSVGYGHIALRTLLPCLTFTATGDTGTTIDFVIDSAAPQPQGDIVYLDVLADDEVSAIWDPAKIDTLIRAPGAFKFDSISQSGSGRCIDYDSSQHAELDSVYVVKYSYWDPATGLESPPGPAIHTVLADSVDNDSIGFAFVTTGWPAAGRPQWIRVWQSVVSPGITGAGDTTEWYGLFQLRTNDSSRQVILGNWSDTDVSIGLDTATITVDTLYEYQIFASLDGPPIMQPPYIFDLQVPFTQIRYAHERFYAVGDPLCPQCLYYNQTGTLLWRDSEFHEIGTSPTDQIVAIAAVENVLYVLLRTQMYFVVGYQAEQETPWGWITDTEIEVRKLKDVGAISRKAVLEFGSQVYWLSPELKVYNLTGEISQPVEDQVDSLFFGGAYSAYGYYPIDRTAERQASLFKYGEWVVLRNDSSGQMLGYHTSLGVWQRLQFEPGYVPLSFTYDTTSTPGLDLDYFFMDSSLKLRRENFSRQFTDVGSYQIPWAQESPGLSYPGRQFSILDGMDISYQFADTGTRTNCCLHYTAYNSRGDSLCHDTLWLKETDSVSVVSWHIYEHRPDEFVTLRLWTQDGDEYIYATDEFGQPLYRDAENNIRLRSVTYWMADGGRRSWR